MSVNIIIPAYNPGKELVEAVKSCLVQSYQDLSITVVDDCSSIDVRKLLWDFPQVSYIRNEKNLGPGGARNVGIKSSSSKYISFLDADDIMHKDKIKLTMEAFSGDPGIGMVCGNYCVMVNRRRLLKPFYRSPIKVNHKALMRQNFVASGSVTVKKEVFDKVGLFNEEYWIAEDYDMWIRIAEEFKIEYVNDILYYYSVVPGGTSLTQRSDIQKKHDINIDKIKKSSRKRLGLK